MRHVLVVLENSRSHHEQPVQDCGMGMVAAQNALARWLASGVTTAFRSKACLTFSVSIHQEGADCDHERGGDHASAS
jgi:hypothetical protein